MPICYNIDCSLGIGFSLSHPYFTQNLSHFISEANMNFGKQLSVFVFLAILSIPLTVAADEETEEVIRLEEVVVTARKREQRSFEVPLSVSTIRGEKSDILRSSGMDVRFLSNRTPSLQIESSFGRIFPRFFIRGLG